MNDRTSTSRQLVRRAFENAAAAYDAAAVLQQEIGTRMLSRLDYMKIVPDTVLDLGSGTGMALPALRRLYPTSNLHALDIAIAMLVRSRARIGKWQRWRGRGVRVVCGDIEHLPLRADTMNMVWSNLALQWVADPVTAFHEIHRVLAPNGLLMFTTFGPDTLRELRQAFLGIDGYSHVNRFLDMHDLGDMLAHAGFADPVMDMEYLTLTYTDARALMRDLKAIGAQTVIADRRPGFMSRGLFAQFERNYETLRRDGRLPATFEVIYGHAWKPAPRISPTGHRVIDIQARE